MDAAFIELIDFDDIETEVKTNVSEHEHAMRAIRWFEAHCSDNTAAASTQPTSPESDDSKCQSPSNRLFSYGARPRSPSSVWAPSPPQAVAMRPNRWTGSEPVTVFHSSVLPPVDLCTYGANILRQVCHGEYVPRFVSLSVVIMQRYAETSSGKRVTAHMAHRLYAAALYVTLATYFERGASSGYHAACAGIDPAEFSALCFELLRVIDWHTLVQQSALDDLYVQARRH